MRHADNKTQERRAILAKNFYLKLTETLKITIILIPKKGAMIGSKKKDKDTKNPEKTEKKSEGKSPKKFIKKILFIFIFLIILGIGSFAGYYFMTSPNVYHKKKLNKVNIPETLVKFSYHETPEIYAGIVEANNRLIMIEKEIERLKTIGKDFPDQETIVMAETSMWENARSNLESLIALLEKNIETYYVSYEVNPEKGKKLIEENNPSLVETMKNRMTASDEYIDRLNTQNDSIGILKTIKNVF